MPVPPAPEPAAAPRRAGAGLALRLLRSPLGRVAASRVIDAPVLWVVTRFWFPLSRLWAAANLAGENVERFADAAGLDPLRGLLRRATRLALAAEARSRAAFAEAQVAWDEAAFGAAAEPRADLAAADRRHRRAVVRRMLGRLWFLPLWVVRRVPPARMEVPTPAAAEAEIAALLGRLEAARVRDLAAAVEASRPLRNGGDSVYWLRFPAPLAEDGPMAWARVTEPAGGNPAASVIFINGVSVDVDRFQAAAAELRALAHDDIRVVELEAPSHGRRQEPGWYSGERFFAQSPVSTVEFFGTMALEIGALAAWCRRQGSRRVAVAGVSMGALAAQSFATASGAWAAERQADALMLITFADCMDEIVFRSGITRRIGLADALRAAGWTPAHFAAVRERVEPAVGPAVPAENIVAVLGAHDTVLPPHLGRALLERWGVPEANVFAYPLGHFSVPVRVARDPAPLARLRDVLLSA